MEYPVTEQVQSSISIALCPPPPSGSPSPYRILPPCNLAHHNSSLQGAHPGFLLLQPPNCDRKFCEIC